MNGDALKGLAMLALIAVVGYAYFSGGNGNGDGGSDGADVAAADVNRRSKRYVRLLRDCHDTVVFLTTVLERDAGQSDVLTVADTVRRVKDVCDARYDSMLRFETDDFGEEATTALVAVEKYRDGLDDMLDYIDSPTASELLDARDNLRSGREYAQLGVDEINERRRELDLAPVKL